MGFQWAARYEDHGSEAGKAGQVPVIPKAFVIIFTSERLWFIVKTKEASCHFLNLLNVTESIFLPTCEDQAVSKFAVVS